MHTTSTSSLIQQWFLTTDEHGRQRLAARWVDDSTRADAAGVA